MRLPAELRNKIYEEYLDDNFISWRRCVNPPPLCMVSHQICAELLPMWGSLAHSAVSYRDLDNTVFVGFNRWMRSMPRRAFISSIHFFRVVPWKLLPTSSSRALRLRLKSSGPRLKWRFRSYERNIVAQTAILLELVKILNEDRACEGLSLHEVEVLRRFLATCREDE